jgi:L-alanine-DL-glutamate epimerase-like enolase superfamily enzyme
MRIEALEVIPYALPFREPYVTARGRLERRELLLVRLHADGLVGLGEAAPLALRGGASLAEIAAELKSDRIVSRQAALALELAQLDLRGKAARVPVHELLGAAEGRPVACNATLVADEPAAVAERALVWSGMGFGTFKLKAGVDNDVQQVHAVRAVLPPDARIRVDANGVWSVDEAAARLDAMGKLELAEQPVATLDELRALAQRVATPLAADESVVSVDDARAAAGICAAATVKLAKVGSVDSALAIARELPVYLSSALDGPVGIAAAAHVAQALDGELAHGLATSLLFADTIATRECAVRAGQLHLTGGPGLGVEIDDDALARHRIDLG